MNDRVRDDFRGRKGGSTLQERDGYKQHDGSHGSGNKRTMWYIKQETVTKGVKWNI